MRDSYSGRAHCPWLLSCCRLKGILGPIKAQGIPSILLQSFRTSQSRKGEGERESQPGGNSAGGVKGQRDPHVDPLPISPDPTGPVRQPSLHEDASPTHSSGHLPPQPGINRQKA